MSEFSENWPRQASLGDHASKTAEGLAYLEDHMKMPNDARLRIAYGLEAIGGLDAAVLAEGNPGAGKTRFGNLVLGSDMRVDIESTDTEDTLFGYPNPINKNERIPGKFSDKLTVGNPIVSANEISHLASTGPLHRLWDDDRLAVNGEMIPMRNAAIYATSNFPDGQRVHELDAAIRSRFAVEVLFGDADSAFVRDLHARDLGATYDNNDVAEGILPNSDARMDLRDRVLRAYTLHGSDFGNYVTDMIEAVNTSPMLTNISATDKRLSSGWQQAVRAMLLVEGAPQAVIGAREAAMVAALVLPTVVTLSQAGKAELKTAFGVAKIDPLTEGVARRRLLASMAYQAVEAREVFPTDNIQQHRDNFRRDYSYASANGQGDVIDGFVEKALEKDPTNANAQPTSAPAKWRRILGRR